MSPLAEVGEGLRGQPLLRPIVLSAVGANLGQGGVLALYVLFATRELGLGPLALGAIFAAGGLGALPGALLAARIARRWPASGRPSARASCWRDRRCC